METWFRRAAIRLFMPVTWGLSRRRTARKLEEFSTIEADSAWQFLRALEAVEDPDHRARLFNNALEEVHHAALFSRASAEYSDRIQPRPQPEREAIFDPDNGGLRRFLAYAYVGEMDVFQQFEAYHAAARPGPAREAFASAMEDESDHVDLAMAILRKTHGSDKAIRREIRNIRLGRAWRTWLRFSKALGEFTSGVLLTVIYFAFGPWLAWACRRARRRPGPEAAPVSAGAAGEVRA